MANSALIALEQYWFSLVPFAIVVFLLALTSVDKLIWIIVFTTPLSLNLEEMELGGIGMFLPTEPLLFGVMLLFFLRVLYDRIYDKEVLKHPMTLIILLSLFWILVTTLTSTMPVVSLKFFLARLWYLVAMYFIGTQLFKKVSNIRFFFWLYIIPLAGVAIYTFIHHSINGFDERSAHWVMQPFFKDHTVYGAVVAMMFPIVLCLLSLKRYKRYSPILIIFMVALALGIIFSYGRAAWISLVAAFAVSLIYVFKIRGSIVFSAAMLVALFGVVFWGDIIDTLEENKQDSTSENLAEHVQSITNISTDASNLERLNRWNSAFKMFAEKPILGWGPGTYSFQYAPFQSSEDLTIISTNAGDMGNAHSEFIGPLSEQGIFGPLFFIILLFVFYTRASILYYKLPSGELRTIVFYVTLAFTTYIINGVLNNFLDTDKASIPFWAFVAIITAIDINYQNMLKQEKQDLQK